MSNDINNKLSSSMEDYLEAILVLSEKNRVARVKDIGIKLNVRNSSVNSAINKLSELGLVTHENYSYVLLTKDGSRKAKEIEKKHRFIFELLYKILKIDKKIAHEDACNMEHAVSPQTFDKIVKFVEFYQKCSSVTTPNWQNNFDYYYRTGKLPMAKINRMKRIIKIMENEK